mmetsp:Transcript_638/g.778  ORF Transcript_638/g.778 Transcript_638/m.778 type:complete len:134 (-) Transcript_638:285-686(-)
MTVAMTLEEVGCIIDTIIHLPRLQGIQQNVNTCVGGEELEFALGLLGLGLVNIHPEIFGSSAKLANALESKASVDLGTLRIQDVDSVHVDRNYIVFVRCCMPGIEIVHAIYWHLLAEVNIHLLDFVLVRWDSP